jgi:uncharacterized membrane protein
MQRAGGTPERQSLTSVAITNGILGRGAGTEVRFLMKVPTSAGKLSTRRFSTRQIAFAGVLGAITVALGLMPVGGFIQIPPVSVTTMHIPTILAGVLEGPAVGGIVGGIFGAFSFWRAQTAINPADKLIFTNPVIAFIPRILIGVVAYYVFALVRGKKGEVAVSAGTALVLGYTVYSATSKWAPLGRWVTAIVVVALTVVAIRAIQAIYGYGPALAAVAGSMTNTVLVLSLCVAFGYLPGKLAAAIAITNGVPEAAVAMILTSLVYRGTRSLRPGSQSDKV